MSIISSVKDFTIALCTNIIVNAQYRNIRLKKVFLKSEIIKKKIIIYFVFKLMTSYFGVRKNLLIVEERERVQWLYAWEVCPSQSRFPGTTERDQANHIQVSLATVLYH